MFGLLLAFGSAPFPPSCPCGVPPLAGELGSEPPFAEPVVSPFPPPSRVPLPPLPHAESATVRPVAASHRKCRICSSPFIPCSPTFEFARTQSTCCLRTLSLGES